MGLLYWVAAVAVIIEATYLQSQNFVLIPKKVLPVSNDFGNKLTEVPDVAGAHLSYEITKTGFETLLLFRC